MSTTEAGTAREGTGVMDTMVSADEARRIAEGAEAQARSHREEIADFESAGLDGAADVRREHALRAEATARLARTVVALRRDGDARDAEIARVTAHRDQLVADAAATAAQSAPRSGR